MIGCRLTPKLLLQKLLAFLATMLCLASPSGLAAWHWRCTHENPLFSSPNSDWFPSIVKYVLNLSQQVLGIFYLGPTLIQAEADVMLSELKDSPFCWPLSLENVMKWEADICAVFNFAKWQFFYFSPPCKTIACAFYSPLYDNVK